MEETLTEPIAKNDTPKTIPPEVQQQLDDAVNAADAVEAKSARHAMRKRIGDLSRHIRKHNGTEVPDIRPTKEAPATAAKAETVYPFDLAEDEAPLTRADHDTLLHTTDRTDLIVKVNTDDYLKERLSKTAGKPTHWPMPNHQEHARRAHLAETRDAAITPAAEVSRFEDTAQRMISLTANAPAIRALLDGCPEVGAQTHAPQWQFSQAGTFALEVQFSQYHADRRTPLTEQAHAYEKFMAMELQPTAVNPKEYVALAGAVAFKIGAYQSLIGQLEANKGCKKYTYPVVTADGAQPGMLTRMKDELNVLQQSMEKHLTDNARAQKSPITTHEWKTLCSLSRAAFDKRFRDNLSLDATPNWQYSH